MPEQSLDALEDRIGESKRVVEEFHVEAGKVAEFARALGDDAALYRDPAAASDAGHPAVPAPLTFVRTSIFPHNRADDAGPDPVFELGFDPAHELQAGYAVDVERPVYVGDVLHAEATLTDVYRREGSDTVLTFAEEELAYRDADGAPVLTEELTFVEALPEAES